MLEKLTKEQKNSFIQSYLLHVNETDKEEVEGLDISNITATGKETVKVEFNNNMKFNYKNGERW